MSIFGDWFLFGIKSFLEGDNAAYYLQYVPGVRVVFLACKEDELAFTVHNGRFDLDMRLMVDARGFLLRYRANV